MGFWFVQRENVGMYAYIWPDRNLEWNIPQNKLQAY